MLLLILFWDYLDYSWFCWPLGGTYTHGDLETGTAPYSAECVEWVFSEVRVQDLAYLILNSSWIAFKYRSEGLHVVVLDRYAGYRSVVISSVVATMGPST